jgi:hypothetical protein
MQRAECGFDTQTLIAVKSINLNELIRHPPIPTPQPFISQNVIEETTAYSGISRITRPVVPSGQQVNIFVNIVFCACLRDTVWHDR